MDFDFSDDQQQLRDAVARWVDKAYTFERRQSIAKQGGFSREVWSELAELGWMGFFNAVNEADYDAALAEVGLDASWDERATNGSTTTFVEVT